MLETNEEKDEVSIALFADRLKQARSQKSTMGKGLLRGPGDGAPSARKFRIFFGKNNLQK